MSFQKSILLAVSIVSFLLLLGGCTEQRTQSTLPSIHPADWNDRTSTDFHGHVALAGGVASCAECHGEDLDGGEVGVSCIDCHLSSGACASCHGGLDNTTGAPPFGLAGETSDTSLAVGAHTAHVGGTSISAPVPCATCHIVPSSILDPSHLDLAGSGTTQAPDSVAELTFSGLASRTGAQTVWNRTSRTCTGSYCHGNFTGGNDANVPVWTNVDTSRCGTCHDEGSNPANLLWKHDFHVTTAGLACNECHANVINADLSFLSPALHVNGIVDTLTRDTAVCNACHGSGATGCTLCHGGIDNQTGAPPKGLEGETQTTQLAVGGHTAHIEGASLADAFACSSCHNVPTSVQDAGHLDGDGVAELNFDPLAGNSSVWNRSNATCQSTYCHGNFPAGDQSNAPVWTGGSNQAQCGSCHDIGVNPSSLGWKHEFHVSAGLNCADCHFNVVDLNESITGLALHVNGVADTLTRDTTVCLQCHGSSTSGCTLCHGGTDNQTGAPPVGLRGETATNQLAVGAHTAHLSTGSLADAFGCDECHTLPDSVLAPGHLGADSVAEITWGTLAGSNASWNRTSATCQTTYCHGDFTGGYQANSPVWTGGTNEAQCGSCHDVGTNPSSLGWKHEFHVSAGLNCADCHSTVVDMSNALVGLSLHVNGVIDTLTRDTTVCLQCHGPGLAGCTLCHGGTDNQTGAPPVGLSGETATNQLAVGAHTAHLSTGSLADAFGCDECHILPDSVLAPGHLGADSTAEITWGALAGANASWNRTSATCQTTYCHGDFTGGYQANSPVWTGGTNEAQCGSCHDVGANPSSLGWKHQFHVENGLNCADCHSNVVDLSDSIIGLALHVNGFADTLTRDTIVCLQCHGSGLSGCTLCHGGTDNLTGAPPVGLSGETATGQLAVGAHTTHLSDQSLADAFACNDCHTVPDSVLAPGHLGADSVAELNFSPLAGQSTTWDRNAATCASSYCHGNFSGGNLSNQPQWTGGSGEAQCGSCHDDGSTPANLLWKHEYHITTGNLQCADCHFGVIGVAGNITDISLHVNGVVDTLIRDTAVCNVCHGAGPTACTGCHGGTDNLTGAPPVGLEGETLTSQLAVGAHTAHVFDGSQADAFDCTACHVKPGSMLDPGHLGSDGIAEITWGDIAPAPSISWDRATATCQNTYCHGNFPGGDHSNLPVWTSGAAAACGSCHDVGSDPSSLGWKHAFHVSAANLNCNECHSGVVDASQNIIDISLHVNGAIDTLTRDQAVCDQCHGSGSNSCTVCHGGTDNLTGAPPDGLSGETATTQLAVGAHTAHMEGGSIADAFQCDECHLVPDSVFATGHLGADSIAELTWGSLAGASSSWNRASATCNNTYCHGNFAAGDNANAPVWTGTNQAACGSCHDDGSNPAELGWKHDVHVRIFSVPCDECHGNVVDNAKNIIDVSLHVNGQLDTLTNPTTCALCHGNSQPACYGCHGGVENQSGAPPRGLRGETATTALAVGAHTSHIEGGAISDGVECSDCHVVPQYFGDPGHYGVDSTAEVTFSALAGGSATWSRGSATCTNIYCHGDFTGGYSSNAPVWTGGNQAACGTCHDAGTDAAQLSGKHDRHVNQRGIACYECHNSVINASDQIINGTLHVNGTKNVEFAAGGTWSNGQCSGVDCHGTKTW